MSQDRQFENLFTEFDRSVDGGPLPTVPQGLAYTRTRGVSAWDRLLRWLVQGRGLLFILFLSFLGCVVTESEAGLNFLGACFTLWTVSPLLGKRPLAHPGRFALLLVPAGAMLMSSAVLVRLFIEGTQTFRDPLYYLARNSIALVERTAEPQIVLWNVLAALGVFTLGRSLAARHPWIEPTPQWSRWRKFTSLLLLGLLFGGLAGVCLATKIAWSQPWLQSPVTEPQTLSIPATLPGDLSEQFPNLLTTTFEPNNLTPTQIQSLYQAAAVRLEEAALSLSDYRILSGLMKHAALSPRREPELNQLAWGLFALQSRATIHTRFNEVLAQNLLTSLAQSSDLSEWRSRIASLTPPPAYSWQQLDEFVAKELKQTAARLGHRKVRLRLLGWETPIDTGQLAYRFETTPALLAYLHARRHQSPQQFIDNLMSRETQSLLWRLGYSGGRVWSGILTQLQELPGNQNLDHQRTHTLLEIVLQVRNEKLARGRYPETVDTLPTHVRYVTDVDGTASLVDRFLGLKVHLP